MWRFNPLPLSEFLASGSPEAQAAIDAISQSLGGGSGGGGADGLSAYQLWLNAGNTGTVNDFLASLVGAPGADGQDGADGLSAYQLWLTAGNTGTVSQFLASLVGATGATGATGPQGLKGDKGDKGDPGVGANPFADAVLVWPFSASLADLRQGVAFTGASIVRGGVSLNGSQSLSAAFNSQFQLDGRPLTVGIRLFLPSTAGYWGVVGQWPNDSSGATLSWLLDVQGWCVWSTGGARQLLEFPWSVGWHTLICDYDGSLLSIEADDTGAYSAATATAQQSNAALGLGGFSDGAYKMPSGSVIRWLAIWRRLLSADERAAVFGKFGKPS